MIKYTCMIVEDEKPAQRILENYLSKIQGLVHVKTCDNAIEAIHFLHQEKVDLLFLDINMPELSGLEMLSSLEHQPGVIITTAYSQYALEGYEFGVVDYLLKPFSFQRFMKAVNRFIETRGTKSSDSDQKTKTSPAVSATLLIRHDSVEEMIALETIDFIQSYGNYLKIVCCEQTYVVRETLVNIEKRLSMQLFLRVHKSYIVQLSKVNRVEGANLIIGKHKIPIGNLYRSAFYNQMKMG